MLFEYPDPLQEVQKWPGHPYWQADIELAAEEAAERKKRGAVPSLDQVMHPGAPPEDEKAGCAPEVPHVSSGDTVLDENDWLLLYTDPDGIEAYLSMPEDLMEEALSLVYLRDPEYAAIVYAVFLRGKGEFQTYDDLMHDFDQVGTDSTWEEFKRRVYKDGGNSK